MHLKAKITNHNNRKMDKVKSIDEFLRIVFKIIDEQTEINKNESFDLFWFRGESCEFEKTSLIPGLYRRIIPINEDGTAAKEEKNSCFYYEMNSKADFDRKSLPYIISKKIENTAWNRYFLMQHYKVNTRLLDWTEDAIKALYFAINDNTSYDAKVWILNPFNLNLFTMREFTDQKLPNAVIPPLSNDSDKPQDLLYENGTIRYGELTRRYLSMDFYQNADKKNYYPLAIYPPFLDERMAAQKTCFTIFGKELNGGFHKIQKSSKNVLYYVTIDGESKKKMLNQLRLIGIDESSVYPDLDGLGKSINDSYKDAH